MHYDPDVIAPTPLHQEAMADIRTHLIWVQMGLERTFARGVQFATPSHTWIAEAPINITSYVPEGGTLAADLRRRILKYADSLGRSKYE